MIHRDLPEPLYYLIENDESAEEMREAILYCRTAEERRSKNGRVVVDAYSRHEKRKSDINRAGDKYFVDKKQLRKHLTAIDTLIKESNASNTRN
jgi:hypothetical protein